MEWETSRRALLAAGSMLGLSRTTLDGTSDLLSLRDFGADPHGRKSAVEAFNRALDSGTAIAGTAGDIYLLDSPIAVPAGRTLLGNGAALRLAPDRIGLQLAQDHCRIAGWTIVGNEALYAVLNTGRYNSFSDNICTGDIGHFFFSTNTEHVLASGNTVEGLTARTEITTAIVVENSRHIRVTGNRFRQIPVGWGIQVRDGSRHFIVSNNEFLQTRWSVDATATAGQRVFSFTLGSMCHLKKVQIGGKPLSTGYTIEGTGPTYTVVFERGRAAGEIISLIGYRGAENIQINTGSRFGTISGNRIDGTGDSGIICYGSHLKVIDNEVRNCGYAGVAVYGGQDHITISGNYIADCAQMDDGLSSPDYPEQASVFAGAILASGDDTVITDNIIRNASGTMRYGVRINKSDMALRTDGSASILISGNRFEGDFADGRISAPNETPGARINSIAVDGKPFAYPGQIDLRPFWTNAPPGGSHIRTSGFGRIWAARDATVTRRAGAVSLRTVAGEYVDFTLTSAALLRNCNVTVSFWAKSQSGRSYVSIFTVLAGLSFPLTADVTETVWRRYAISFPLTAKLEDIILIRCGAIEGHANIQDIEITARRL